jgi:non-specific serine/threonine protein kinase
LQIQSGVLGHSDLPFGVKESQGAAVCGKLYVFGGFTNGWSKKQKQTFEYDPANNKWAKKTDIPGPWTGISHMGNAWDESTCRIWLTGGLALYGNNKWPNAASVKTVFEYNAKSGSWTTMPTMPQPRGGGVAVYIKNVLYHIAGATFSNSKFTKDCGDLFALDLKAIDKGWKVLATNSHGRNHLGAAAYGGNIYVMGGQYFELEGCTNQVHSQKYIVGQNKWVDIAPLPVAAGHLAPSVLVGTHGIFAIGGAMNKMGCHPPGKHKAIIQHYNPAEDKWYIVESHKRLSGGSMVCGMIDGRAYIQHDTKLASVKLGFVKN